MARPPASAADPARMPAAKTAKVRMSDPPLFFSVFPPVPSTAGAPSSEEEVQPEGEQLPLVPPHRLEGEAEVEPQRHRSEERDLDEDAGPPGRAPVPLEVPGVEGAVPRVQEERPAEDVRGERVVELDGARGEGVAPHGLAEVVRD